jgi:hypothetical protein
MVLGKDQPHYVIGHEGSTVFVILNGLVALKVASGESDWIGQHSEWLYAILLFAGSLLCVALAYYVLQFRVLRRATREAAAN